MLMGVAAAAAAQVRTIPKEAQRGEIRHLQDMHVELNGKRAAALAGRADSRRGNRVALPTSLAEKYDVRFLLDGTGPGAPRVDHDAARANAGAAKAAAGRDAACGRQMKKLYLRTFGCQMNEYDSEKIADVLRDAEGLRAHRAARRTRT